MNQIYLMLFFSSTLLYITSIYSHNADENYHRCGNQLTALLADICGGNYYIPKIKKAPVNDIAIVSPENELSDYKEYYNMKLVEAFNKEQKKERERIRQQRQREQHLLPFPFKNKINAFEMVSNRFSRQTRGGIVDECCNKSCTFSELQDYCGDN